MYDVLYQMKQKLHLVLRLLSNFAAEIKIDSTNNF